MPGEIAPAHHHVASAIRFVLDGEGAYTAVEGEKSMMSHGDFVITPNWSPHDHGNVGKMPVTWLDVVVVLIARSRIRLSNGFANLMASEACGDVTPCIATHSIADDLQTQPAIREEGILVATPHRAAVR